MPSEDALGSQTPIGTDLGFTPLRLPGTPAKTLQGWLTLEDVLNALGQQDHPDQWGRLPGWSSMPFRWVGDERRHVRFELRVKGSRARLRRKPVEHTFTRGEGRACLRLYRKVRTTVREAFEAGQLTAHAVHDATGHLSQILSPAVWLKQAGPIFYTGRIVIREPGLPDRLADVVIKRTKFDRWMETRRKEQRKNTSVAMLKRAGELIDAHKRERDYAITRAEATALVRNAAQKSGWEVSQRQFNKVVWTPFKAKAGRPTKAQKKSFVQHSAELSGRLAALFEGPSGT